MKKNLIFIMLIACTLTDLLMYAPPEERFNEEPLPIQEPRNSMDFTQQETVAKKAFSSSTSSTGPMRRKVPFGTSDKLSRGLNPNFKMPALSREEDSAAIWAEAMTEPTPTDMNPIASEAAITTPTKQAARSTPTKTGPQRQTRNVMQAPKTKFQAGDIFPDFQDRPNSTFSFEAPSKPERLTSEDVLASVNSISKIRSFYPDIQPISQRSSDLARLNTQLESTLGKHPKDAVLILGKALNIESPTLHNVQEKLARFKRATASIESMNENIEFINDILENLSAPGSSKPFISEVSSKETMMRIQKFSSRLNKLFSDSTESDPITSSSATAPISSKAPHSKTTYLDAYKTPNLRKKVLLPESETDISGFNFE